jgi:hypothetical protein
MRNIAGLLLIVSFVMHLLLGGGSLISSKYEELKAQTDAGDLSAVAGDIVDAKTLAKERARTAQRMDTSKATRKRVFGILILVAAAAQFAAAILLFLGRARRIVLGVVGLSAATTAAHLALSSRSLFAVIGLVLLILALVLTALAPKPASAS